MRLPAAAFGSGGRKGSGQDVECGVVMVWCSSSGCGPGFGGAAGRVQQGSPGGGVGEVAGAGGDGVQHDAVGAQQDGVGAAAGQPGGQGAVVPQVVDLDRGGAQ